MILVYSERVGEVRDDEISEKTKSRVIKGTVTSTVQHGATPTKLGEGKDEAGRAVEIYVPVRVGASELKEVESVVRRCRYEIMNSREV